MTPAQWNEYQRQAEEIEKHEMYKTIITEANNKYVIEDEIDAFIKGAYWMLNKINNKNN